MASSGDKLTQISALVNERLQDILFLMPKGDNWAIIKKKQTLKAKRLNCP